jgi:hypothetical protein
MKQHFMSEDQSIGTNVMYVEVKMLTAGLNGRAV